jgi:hypothetical protein
MILNYMLIVERYPKPSGVVGGSVPSREILFVLERKT